MIGHVNRSAFRKLLIGLALLSIAVFWAMPEDLFTSAFFFDSLPLQQTFSGRSKMFGPGSFFKTAQTVSVSAVGFTLALFVTQIAAGYAAASDASWGEARNRSGKIEMNNLIQLLKAWIKGYQITTFNYGKLTKTVLYWLAAIADTYFDADFKVGGSGAWGQALLVSFLYYSLASEIFLVLGFNWVLEATRDLFRPDTPWRSR